jgi:hypothetical protein
LPPVGRIVWSIDRTAPHPKEQTMNRRLVSVLLAASSMTVLTGAAVALGNSVSTTPAPAFVRSAESGLSGDDHGSDDPATHDLGDDDGSDGNGADDPATHDLGDDHGGSASLTTSTSTPSTTVTTTAGGADDPASHDAGDDGGHHQRGRG